MDVHSFFSVLETTADRQTEAITISADFFKKCGDNHRSLLEVEQVNNLNKVLLHWPTGC